MKSLFYIFLLLFFYTNTYSQDELYTVTKVAEGVYLFNEHKTTKDFVDGNSTAIITDEGVVVVDAPGVYLSKKHLAEIRKITDQPVRYLINTHWHFDHIMGNQVYKNAFPDLQIIAHDRGKAVSDRRNPVILKRNAAIDEDDLKELKNKLEPVKTLTEAI